MTALYSKPCKPLLDWYAQHARVLPWRKTTDPYAIWVSEVMLQQTQVRTVLPRYQQWLKDFIDISALADADESRVLKAWEGLGYYRRARYLHRAAKQIMTMHQGRFPDKFQAILALPGVGRSTAGAIASFAFALPYPVLDGNVRRVLTRLYGQHTEAEQWQIADALLQASGQPAQWNQATMELGATLCGRKPDCLACPLKAYCQAFKNKQFDTQASKKTKSIDIYWDVQLHRRGTNLWLHQRPEKGIWGGLWSPPIKELSCMPERSPLLIHPLTHRRIHLYITHQQANIPADLLGQWFSQDELPAIPTGISRLLRVLDDESE